MRSIAALTVFFLQVLSQNAQGQVAQTDGTDISLDSLLNVKITTASKQWELASNAPASVSVISSDDIARFGYRTLDDVLSGVPGFYTSYDRNYAYIGVRGFSRPTDYNDRILLLVNGHTYNEGFYGSAPFGTDFAIDLSVVDRIEIVRGPGSVLYGSGAMFGVVNVITKQGAEFDRIQVSFEGGSFRRKKGALVIGKEISDKLDGILSVQWTDIAGEDLYYKEYDSDSTNRGSAKGLDWDKYYAIFSTVRYDGLSFQGAFLSREKGIPTGAYDIVFNDPRAKTLDNYGTVEMKLNRSLGGSVGLMIRAYYDKYYYAGTFPYGQLTFDETHANRAGSELQVQWDLSSSNRLVSGVEYVDQLRADYHYWDDQTTYFSHNYPYTMLSFYVQDEHQVGTNLSISVGLRRDAHSTSGNTIAPRAALVFHPSLWTSLKLLYGQAYRTPNMYERYYEDVLGGFKANHDLTRERITTLELGWEQRLTEELYSSTSLYTYTMKDLVDQVIDPTDSLLQFRNIQPVKASGVETNLTCRFHVGLIGYANYTYELARSAESNHKLTNVPLHLARIGLSYDPCSFIRTSLELQYQTGRTTVQGTTTDPFLVTNLSLASLPLSRSDLGKNILQWLRMSLLVRNVFNVSYTTPGGFEHKQLAIQQNGREWIGKIELSF